MSSFLSEVYADPIDWDEKSDGYSLPEIPNTFMIEIHFASSFEHNLWRAVEITSDYDEYTARAIVCMLMNQFSVHSFAIGSRYIIFNTTKLQLETIKMEIQKTLRVAVCLLAELPEELQQQISTIDFRFEFIRSMISASFHASLWMALLQEEYGHNLFGRMMAQSRNIIESVLLDNISMKGADSAYVCIKVFYYRIEPLPVSPDLAGINILTNEACRIRSYSNQWISAFDLCNIQHGYSTYLPTTAAEFLLYWRLVHGVQVHEHEERVEVMAEHGPHIIPAKLLVRHVNIMRFRTRTEAQKIADDVTEMLRSSTYIVSARLIKHPADLQPKFQKASDRSCHR